MNDTQKWLDKGHALADQATQGPWEAVGSEVAQHWSLPEPWHVIVDTEVSCMDYCYGGSAKGVERDEDAEFIADARTRLPQALNALQAVLALHKPIDAHNVWNTEGRLQQVCTGCGQDDGNWTRWPCPTVRAIQTELERKETQS